MEQLTHITQQLLAAPGGSLPGRLLAALAIGVAAWLAARVVKAALTRFLQSRGVDERLHNPGFSASMGQLAAGLAWLFALPALLDTLGLAGLLAPVNAMMSRLLSFVPSLMGAIVVLAAGLLLARVLRQIVEGLLQAAGSERLSERLGLASALGERTLAGLVGSVVFGLILLPTLAAALQTLGLEVLATPVSRLVDQVLALVPRLASAAFLIVITVVVGRVTAQLLATLLAGLRLDRVPALIGLRQPHLAGRTVTEWIGRVWMVGIVFIGLTQAAEVLGLPVLSTTVAALGQALVRLAVALLVLGVGLWLATLAARAIEQGPWSWAPQLALLARAGILCFAGALALHQAGLPGEIVSLAFAAIVGSLALGVAVGLAIAIGWGGRPWAARLFERLQPSGSHQDAAQVPPPADRP